jgi:hypothetical protein
MDAVHWKEWRLFGITNDSLGLKLFILAHLPLFFIILTGLINVNILFGKIISIVISVFLIVHFFLHISRLGRDYFKNKISFSIITGMMIISIVQLVATLLSLNDFIEAFL